MLPSRFKSLLGTVLLSIGMLAGASHAATTTLLNASYDPTRELYEDYNKEFAKYWKAKTGNDVEIKQSHGGSGKQADVVTFRHAAALAVRDHRRCAGALPLNNHLQARHRTIANDQ